jgi:GTP-binding nuclear protein Ran
MAYRDGYFQALKDLYRDGILSAEEFKKREAQMETAVFSEPNFGALNTVTVPETPDEIQHVDDPDMADRPLTGTDEFVIRENNPTVSSLSPTIPSYKICLIGDGGVGKTTFVKRLRNGEFQTKYFATMGVSVEPLLLMTSIGPIKIDVWDTAGQEKFRGLQEGFYVDAHGFIIMYDVTNANSYKNLANWYKEVRDQSPKPMVLVGNKCEVAARRVKPKAVTFHRKINLQYYEVSTKLLYNIEKPFLYLIRRLTGDSNLTFVSSTTEKPLPEVPLNNEVIARYEEELKRVDEADMAYFIDDDYE